MTDKPTRHRSWSTADCPDTSTAIDQCVYGSRLLGSDPNLVLHGGGNSSVKAPFVDITGEEISTLYVKGSGWDMATIEAPGFAPLPIDRLQALLDLDRLSDEDMMRELSRARLDPSAPQPSVETLLHAFLPAHAVQHSHADSIVSLTNNIEGEQIVRAVYGDDVVIVPYVMPGFDLAKAVAESWEAQSHEGTLGLVLLHHGLFSFGDSTRQAYERHIALIERGLDWLDDNAAYTPPHEHADDCACCKKLSDELMLELVELRRKMSAVAGRPLVVSRHRSPAIQSFVERKDLWSIANRGPLTPDHIIRTKRVPLVGRDVEAYVDEYEAYFQENAGRTGRELEMLDAAPRVVLDPELGMLTSGTTVKAADICRDIYEHTIPVLERLEDKLGGYLALTKQHLFDVEYWDLEQAKLKLAGPLPQMAGSVALVTGAASGIGRACVAELLDRGAAVVGVDRAEDVVSTFDSAAWLGVACDVTDHEAQRDALRKAVERFGGLDVLVVGAGIFGETQPIAELDDEQWSRVMAVNVDSVASLFKHAAPLLERSPIQGRVAVIASKNTTAPGQGAAAYSASKAALTQLARIASLEWAAHGIRVNVVHPDAVFDTALWTPELLSQRAAKYGLTEEQYKTRNLLGREVRSRDVAKAVAHLCSDDFPATTGAQIPIDGGSDRVI